MCRIVKRNGQCWIKGSKECYIYILKQTPNTTSKLPTQQANSQRNKQTPNATRILTYILFCFYSYQNNFHWLHFLTIIKIWHARTSTGLLDENRKSCCTWNWLVLYGNHVCHSTVHWLSLDNATIFFFYLVFKNNKFWCWHTLTSKGLWTLRRCPVVGIFQSLPYQDCGRNITNNV